MRPRTRQLLVALATVGGALLIGAPARSQSPPPPPHVVVSNYEFRTSPAEVPPNTPNLQPARVIVGAGGTVTFAYSAFGGGTVKHNVNFTGMQPSSCQVTSGPGMSPVPGPPLPQVPTGPGWTGECTFVTPGTYAFVCGVHTTQMTGSVTVPGAVTSPPPPPPPAPMPGPPPPPVVVPPAASVLRVSGRQRGTTVRGSVKVTTAGSRLLARAFARRKALSGGRSTRQVQVGRVLDRSVGSGREAFAVKLYRTARRALRRNGRLSISLRLTVTPPFGAPYRATRTVTLRR